MTFWEVLCWWECVRYERGTREAGSHSLETIWVVGGVARLVRLGVVTRQGANLPLLHHLNLSLRVAQTVSKVYARAQCRQLPDARTTRAQVWASGRTGEKKRVAG